VLACTDWWNTEKSNKQFYRTYRINIMSSVKETVQTLTSLFSLTLSHFVVFFSGDWIENFLRIPKMCLKMFFSRSKWVLQAILSLTVLSNCVSSSSKFDTAFLSHSTKFCSVFFRLLDRKFDESSKNVLKSVLFSSQVGFTGDFVPQTVFLTVQILTPLFSFTVPNFVVFFQVVG